MQSMLLEVSPGRFEATCDHCGRPSDVVEGSKEVAITRVSLRQWQVRQVEGRTFTSCIFCRSSSTLIEPEK